MIFIPYNRNISIELKTLDEKEETLEVLLPADYKKAENPYSIVKISESGAALNCQLDWFPEQLIVVESHMIKEIHHRGEIFYTVLENYVLGELRRDES
jgi:hypothetical protein